MVIVVVRLRSLTTWWLRISKRVFLQYKRFVTNVLSNIPNDIKSLELYLAFRLN